MLRNLTPHAVRVLLGEAVREFPSEGAARVQDATCGSSVVDGVPVAEVRPGDVSGLPGPEPGVTLIVSRVTAQALPGRTDLVFPFDEVRDEAGTILGVRGLARWHAGGHEA